MISSSIARIEDIPILVELYSSLEEEMVSLHPMWPLADGLPDPIDSAFQNAIEDPESDRMLPRAAGETVASIRLVFVEEEARQVSVGESMRDMALEIFRARGITKFDAYVLPGHRLAKNFFEAGGFSARLIVMHHDDER